jgi:hypothetical protein
MKQNRVTSTLAFLVCIIAAHYLPTIMVAMAALQMLSWVLSWATPQNTAEYAKANLKLGGTFSVTAS